MFILQMQSILIAVPEPVLSAECSFAGCGRVATPSGLCRTHRTQRSRGRVLTPIVARGVGRTLSAAALEDYQRQKMTRTSSKMFRRRRDVLDEIKSEKGCTDCGYNTNPVALQFDHRPGEVKSFTIAAAAASRSMEAILAEVTKCDVVCANCHAIRSAGRLVRLHL